MYARILVATDGSTLSKKAVNSKRRISSNASGFIPSERRRLATVQATARA